MMNEADRIARRVVEFILRVVPPEVFADDRAWAAVEEPSARLLKLLGQLDRGEVARKAVEKAGNDVVAAWRNAAKEYGNRAA